MLLHRQRTLHNLLETFRKQPLESLCIELSLAGNNKFWEWQVQEWQVHRMTWEWQVHENDKFIEYLDFNFSLMATEMSFW